MSSIRRQLLLWLLALVVAGVGLAGWLIYRQALAEANELFDYQLQEIAGALPSESFSQALNAHSSGEESIVIQIWNRSGMLMYYSRSRVLPAPPALPAQPGFSTAHTEEGDWRVYSALVGENVVQLAQPVSVRNRLAANVALRTLWPLIVLLPFLGVAVWGVVGRGLAPLARVARALDARHPEALDALPLDGLPREVAPLVRALNALLARLAHALDTQKSFVADAAHELRTPLAAVQIQAQLVARAQDGRARREALADLQAGVTRATRLAQQLLALARSEPGGQTSRQWIDLRALLADCVAAYAPLAQQRGVDLGLDEMSGSGEAAGAGGESRDGLGDASAEGNGCGGFGKSDENASGGKGAVDSGNGKGEAGSKVGKSGVTGKSDAGSGIANDGIAGSGIGESGGIGRSAADSGIASGEIAGNGNGRGGEIGRSDAGSGIASGEIANDGIGRNIANGRNVAGNKSGETDKNVASGANGMADAGAGNGKTIGNGKTATRPLTTIHADADALRAMFDNLLDNATKYTPSGGRVDVGLFVADGHPVVRIADSGPGIAPGERARVFDRFYRVGAGVARAPTDVAGTGLGLAIVQRVADQHGATVALGDSVAGGLQVEVRF